MEKYTIKNQDSFNLKDIFECGQCFRWNKQEDGSYIGVIKDAVIKVEQNEKEITFTGVSKNDFKTTVRNYFDLDVDYNTKTRFMGMHYFFYHFR